MLGVGPLDQAPDPDPKQWPWSCWFVVRTLVRYSSRPLKALLSRCLKYRPVIQSRRSFPCQILPNHPSNPQQNKRLRAGHGATPESNNRNAAQLGKQAIMATPATSLDDRDDRNGRNSSFSSRTATLRIPLPRPARHPKPMGEPNDSSSAHWRKGFLLWRGPRVPPVFPPPRRATPPSMEGGCAGSMRIWPGPSRARRHSRASPNRP